MSAARVLSVPGLFPLPDLADVARLEPRADVSLRETYHDAPDLRLVRAGLLLCHHTGERDPHWTLSLPGGDVETEPGSAAPEPVPARLRGLLTARLRGADAEPVAVLRTDRRAYRLRDAGSEPCGELVDDTVSVLDGRRVAARFRELVLSGDDAGSSARVVEVLTAAGAVEEEPLPRVLRALGPRAAAPPDVAPPAPPAADGPAEALVAAALRGALHGIVEADLAVRRGGDDAVHRLRVACRRLRSDLTTYSELVFPGAAAHLRAELAWLVDALGAARDLEVLRARLRRTAGADPLARLDADAVARIDALLVAEEEAASDAAGAAMRSGRYIALLDALAHWAVVPPTTDAARVPCREVVPSLLGAAWRRLVRAVGALEPDDPDERWHDARIVAKRARYAAEAAVPVLGEAAARPARAAAALQDVLGEHQDAALAADRLLALAAGAPHDPGLVLTAGRLAERERAAVRRARARFPAVRAAATRRKVTKGLKR